MDEMKSAKIDRMKASFENLTNSFHELREICQFSKATEAWFDNFEDEFQDVMEDISAEAHGVFPLAETLGPETAKERFN
jgi:predicted ATPase